MSNTVAETKRAKVTAWCEAENGRWHEAASIARAAALRLEAQAQKLQAEAEEMYELARAYDRRYPTDA